LFRHIRTKKSIGKQATARNVSAAKRYNEASDGRINFKLGGNCHSEVRIT